MALVDVIRNNPYLSTSISAVSGGALALAGAGVVGAVRKKKTKRKKATTRRTKKATSSYKRKTKRTTTRRRAKTSGHSTKKIYYTSKGQPYIKMASGKARFIKKSSAKTRKKRKGGYY